MLDRFLSRTARLAVRRRRAVLLLTVAFAIIAGAVGSGVFPRLGSSGFQDPGADSSKALTLLQDRFGTGEPDLVLVVTARKGTVDDADNQAAGREVTSRLQREADVVDVASYWTLGSPAALRSNDGRRALVVARTNGGDDRRAAIAKQVLADFQTKSGTTSGAVQVQVGGLAAAYSQISTTIEKDLARAEAIAIPITLVLLILIFGSIVSAGLPLLFGGLSIVGAFLSLFVITQFTDVSIFAINLVTAMGLGLGIDYSLFMVSRFREELARGIEVEEAVVRTLRTAGRTVIFSGLTVALALSAMLVFPLYFLRSFAYAGIAVVALAITGAVVVLPALLSVLGRRVDSLMVLRRSATPTEEGAWARIARFVMRRPWPVALGVIAILLGLGAPFLGVHWGQADDRALPASASVRQAGDLLRTQFSGRETGSLSVVLPQTTETAAYAARLSTLASVSRVETATGTWVSGRQVSGPAGDAARFTAKDRAGSWLTVVPTVDSYSAAGEQLVKDIRATPAPGTAYVGGAAAEGLDTKHALSTRLPWALGIVALSTAILLFLFTGSIVVPIKALVLNTLSLSATFGAMVWVFQDGHLSGLLDFTPTGVLDMSIPILMFCIAFGLSMDYEVFLLSRIKEEYDRTRNNALAVERGLQRTGRIVTAAALLLSIVFIAFSSSGVTTIKLMGVGVALAILMDATLVRGLLVPAFMRLAGDWNWWAPGPLRRLYSRFGLGEGDDLLVDGRQDPAAVGSAR
jgi:RND superfamily putative drug exporter